MAAVNVSRSQSTRPYFLTSIDQLPETLLALAKSYLPESQSIEGVFVVPPETYKHGPRWSLNPIQAIIFTQQGILHLSTSTTSGQPKEGIWISAEDIFKIKLSLILLYGKLEILGVQNEQIKKIELEYNTVAHNLLAPVLHGLIKKTWQNNPVKSTPMPKTFTISNFGSIPFSFYNGLYTEAIQLEEHVLWYGYQPEIKEPRLRIFHKKLFPQIVMTLTDQQLILLQEDLNLKTHQEWIFSFIPLYRIAAIKQFPYKTWQRVVIQLITESNQQSIDLILEPEHAEIWRAIWTNVNEIGEE